MFSKNTKPKRHPWLTVGLFAMAAFGAYSAVTIIGECCKEKMSMLTRAMKRKKCTCASSETEDMEIEEC